MTKFRFLQIILIVASGMASYAQENPAPIKEIGISFFALEMNSETLNPRLVPKFVYGLYFNRHYSNWSWITSAGFGKNLIFH
jgi:hypothetical protein